jgi:hypothetical protein
MSAGSSHAMDESPLVAVTSGRSQRHPVDWTRPQVPTAALTFALAATARLICTPASCTPATIHQASASVRWGAWKPPSAWTAPPGAPSNGSLRDPAHS